MLSMIGSQNRFMVMVLATSRKLCLRLAHAPNGTQGILISYCVMRILMKSLRSAYGCCITNGALWLLLSVSKQRCPQLYFPPYLEVVQMPPPFYLSYLKNIRLGVRTVKQTNNGQIISIYNPKISIAFTARRKLYEQRWSEGVGMYDLAPQGG